MFSQIRRRSPCGCQAASCWLWDNPITYIPERSHKTYEAVFAPSRFEVEISNLTSHPDYPTSPIEALNTTHTFERRQPGQVLQYITDTAGSTRTALQMGYYPRLWQQTCNWYKFLTPPIATMYQCWPYPGVHPTTTEYENAEIRTLVLTISPRWRNMAPEGWNIAISILIYDASHANEDLYYGVHLPFPGWRKCHIAFSYNIQLPKGTDLVRLTNWNKVEIRAAAGMERYGVPHYLMTTLGIDGSKYLVSAAD